MIFNDAAHLCFLLFHMENQAINLFTDRLTSREKLQGGEMQQDRDFHTLA